MNIDVSTIAGVCMYQSVITLTQVTLAKSGLAKRKGGFWDNEIEGELPSSEVLSLTHCMRLTT